MDNRPIGFFDSGLGGLTCIPYLLRDFPQEKIVYFGDTARTPYGSKSKSTITKFAVEIADFLIETHDIKMLAIACNTVSAIACDVLRQRHPGVPVIGIINPAVRMVTNTCSSENRIGVIGTKATIESDAYKNRILHLNPELKTFGQACPALVPLIEEGILNNPIMDMTIKYYLDDFLKDNNIDTLVLGCTHYPLIRNTIDLIYPGMRIIDPSEEMIQDIKEYLDGSNLYATEGKPDHVFYASDLSENFVNMINLMFSGNDYPVSFIDFDLENYLNKRG